MSDLYASLDEPFAEPANLTESAPFKPRLWRVPSVVWGVLLVTALFSALVFAGSEMVFTQAVSSQHLMSTLVSARSHALQLHDWAQQAQTARWAYWATGNKDYLNGMQHASRQALMHYGLMKGLLIQSDDIKTIVPPEPVQALGNLLQDELSGMDTQGLGGQPPSAALPSFTPSFEQVDQALQNALKQTEEKMGQTLASQRIGTVVLVGLNLLFLSALAARTIRHFYAHERQRLSFSTHTKKLEAAVRQRTTELHELTTYLQKQSEQEKSRLARELHDELGSLLTSAKLDLAWLQGRNPGQDPSRTDRLDKLSRSLDQALNIKRRVIDNLRPSLLDHMGLGPALIWYVQETCDKAGLVHQIDVPQEGVSVDTETGLALYRIVQEALNNTIQHARAHELRVVLKSTPWEHILRIQDDGVGLSVSQADHLSHGMAGMRHRAVAIGADFSVRSGPGLGTSIEVRLPRSDDRKAQISPETHSEAVPDVIPDGLGDEPLCDGIPRQFSIARHAHFG